jgi:hypothetical protein
VGARIGSTDRPNCAGQDDHGRIRINGSTDFVLTLADHNRALWCPVLWRLSARSDNRFLDRDWYQSAQIVHHLAFERCPPAHCLLEAAELQRVMEERCLRSNVFLGPALANKRRCAV